MYSFTLHFKIHFGKDFIYLFPSYLLAYCSRGGAGLERKGERASQADSMLDAEPKAGLHMGLDLMSPRSQLEPKSRVTCSVNWVAQVLLKIHFCKCLTGEKFEHTTNEIFFSQKGFLMFPIDELCFNIYLCLANFHGTFWLEQHASYQKEKPVTAPICCQVKITKYPITVNIFKRFIPWSIFRQHPFHFYATAFFNMESSRMSIFGLGFYGLVDLMYSPWASSCTQISFASSEPEKYLEDSRLKLN